MRCLWLMSVLLLLQSCTGAARAPVEGKVARPTTPATVTSQGARSSRDRLRSSPVPPTFAQTYTVVKGDTLYSLAWRHHLDYRELARWNSIGSPYLIYPRDRLALSKPASLHPVPRPQPAANPPGKARVNQPGAKPPVPKQPVAIKPVPKTAVSDSAPLRWRWPSKGKHRKADSPTGKKGLQILGNPGQTVSAAAPGVVVYSGGGLIGYGKLIIIKHSGIFLSAYAHNARIFVKEGAEVAAGQKIAEMGSSGAKEVMLHFEIRRNGKPVPPLDYLPKS